MSVCDGVGVRCGVVWDVGVGVGASLEQAANAQGASVPARLPCALLPSLSTRWSARG